MHRHGQIFSGLGRFTKTQHVDRENVVRGRQGRRDALPVFLVPADAVNNHHSRAGAHFEIGELFALNIENFGGGGGHGWLLLCKGRNCESPRRQQNGEGADEHRTLGIIGTPLDHVRTCSFG